MEKAVAPKRRVVSKATLYKELVSFASAENIGNDAPVGTVLDALKDAIVADAISR